MYVSLFSCNVLLFQA